MESITAILTVYRRPHTLVQQLAAIQNQSVPPSQIFIWKNQYDGIDLPEIPQELMKNVSIINSSKNFGVWARFAVGLLASSTYIAVFDDDILSAMRGSSRESGSVISGPLLQTIQSS